MRVQVRQVGISPLLFWDGDAWVTRAAYVEADLHNNGSWTLPDVELTAAGSYRVLLTVDDNNGNTGTWRDYVINNFQVRSSDSAKPVAQVLTPAAGSILSPGTIDISGTATDSDSGVSSVRVQVRQAGISPLLFWDGDAWVTSWAFPEANLNGDDSWTLPDVELTASGSYRVLLTVVDNDGNTGTWRDYVINDFEVQ